MTATRDLSCRADFGVLVRRFYAAVREDDLLGPVFAARIRDWEPHLVTMERFWATVMLGEHAYQGNPLAVHRGLALDGAHFARWLALWQDAVDALFVGPVADATINRAERIASTLTRRLAEVA